VVPKGSNARGEGQENRRDLAELCVGARPTVLMGCAAMPSERQWAFMGAVVGQAHCCTSREDWVSVALFSVLVALFLWLCIPV